MPETLICNQCGITFTRKKRPIGKKVFCTQYCSNKSQIGIPFTQERKDKISKSNLGKIMSEEAIEKSRQKNIGRKQTPETIQKRKETILARKEPRFKTQKLEYEFVAKKFEEGGCKLLSKEYKNERTKLEYICNCGRKALILFDSFRRGIRCSICGHERGAEKYRGYIPTRIHKERQSISQKAVWQNPEYIKMMTSRNPIFCNTKPELKMKSVLNSLNIQYQTQKRMNIVHTYLCDFYVPKYNCVIEVDGIIFHAHPSRFKPDDIVPLINITAKQKWEEDAIRTKELQEAGYKVLRFWENEVTEDNVKKRIIEVI